MKTTHCLVALAAAAALTAPAISQAADSNAGADEGARLVTDFSGKPPFKRRVVASDSAEADTVPAVAEEGPVQVVDFRSAPPFKRRVVDADEIETADFARFEETDDAADDRSRRRGPPGKMTSRR